MANTATVQATVNEVLSNTDVSILTITVTDTQANVSVTAYTAQVKSGTII